MMFVDFVTIDAVISPLTLALAVCLLTWILWSRKPPNSPPGTNGIPFIGVLLSLERRFPEKVMQKWASKYGPLYMVKFGFTDVVVISSPEIAYEAFAKNNCFNDRPQSLPAHSGSGIVLMNSSDFTKEQRRFGLNALRDLGMGRRSLEPKLLEIANELCEKIEKYHIKGKSKAINISPFIYDSISSIISCIVFGHDVAKENENFRALISQLTTPDTSHALAAILMFAPFLRHLPFFSRIWKSSQEFGIRFKTEVMKEVTKHEKSRDFNDPRDFLDSFLNEMDKANGNSASVEDGIDAALSTSDWETSASEETELFDYSKGWKRYSSFTVDQLLGMGQDLFLAGSDTTATLLLWVILFLSKHPDVQTKMQEEIHDVLGHNGIPRMSMLEKFPYVRAVIQEVSRIRPIVPLNIPHKASRDASLMGYQIPKDAIILTNIWAIHHDPARWPEPEKFFPERHIDEKRKFVKSTDWMIFSTGSRSCLGQQLAKMEMFILTVILFRRFSFTFPPGYEPDMNGENIVVLRPFPFEVVAQQR